MDSMCKEARAERETRRGLGVGSPTSPLGVGGLERLLFQPQSPPSGKGLSPSLPPPLDLDGGSRAVRTAEMAQYDSTRTSASPRCPPRWFKIAQDGSRWTPRPP
eukprot:6246198-Pyramimonas_sp.AAC.1